MSVVRKPRAESQEPRAESRKPRAESREPKAEKGTVVIVTHNSAECIGDCLDSLAPEGKVGRFKVVVVDNLSTDGSADIVEARYPWAVLVRSSHNGGFAAGNNLGLEHIEGEACFFLNPDAVVEEGCIDRLMCYLNENSDVGCAGPGISDAAGSRILTHFAFTSLFTSIWAAVSLQRILPLNRSNGRWELRRRPPRTTVDVDRLLGAAMMVRRQALEEVGGFDERFFLYSEEEDLCRRLWSSGWRVVYNPAATVIHKGAASTGAANPTAIAAANWSRYLYLRKHCSRLSAELSRLVWMVMIYLRYLVVCLQRLFGADNGTLAGYRLALKSLWRPGYFDQVVRPAVTGG